MKSHSISTKRLIILLFAFCCIVNKSEGQLVANFKSTPTGGCSPLYVEFQDLSTGNAIKWVWDLGNNTTAEVRNPTTTYFATGTYTIILKIFNAAGDSSVLVRKKYIEVSPIPNVDFSASKTEDCSPLEIEFKDLSDGKSDVITKWEWDFGDGNIGAGNNPTHIYKNGGDYNVSLKITNKNGCKNFLTKKSFIKIYPQPVAEFTSKFAGSCSAPASVLFSSVDDGKGSANIDYKWNFGDGKTGSGSNPIHIYNAGEYDVTLVATNQFGCSDTLKKLNYLSVGKIKAQFSAPESGCIGTKIDFKNMTSPTPQSVFWDFGDGTFSTDEFASNSYKITGIYFVKLVVKYGNCEGSVVKRIEIKKSLHLDFEASKLFSCTAPLTVDFTNLTPGENNYKWYFSEQDSADTKDAKYTYTREGEYSVRLIGSNAGCSDTLIRTGLIKIGKPEAKLNLPADGCVPFTHQFSASITPFIEIKSYRWDFGDGHGSDLATPFHEFKVPGSYTISLTYTTSDGCVNYVEMQDGVKTGTPPSVKFDADPLSSCAKDFITFTNLSTNVGNSPKWKWEFGDGGTSFEKNPKHIFQNAGMFNVKLIVTNNGCPGEFVKSVYIDPPVAEFIYKQDCNILKKVQFSDKSIGADKWEWNFGDGNTSQDKNPSHQYTDKGNYQVSLTVSNNKSGCSFTKQMEILVIHESPKIILDKIESCKNTPIKFSAEGVNPSNIKTYTWNFGDTSKPKAVSSTSTLHSYTSAGEFNVSLTIKDNNNCETIFTKEDPVKISGLTAIFGMSDTVICKNDQVSFFDSSYNHDSTGIVSWEWNFGDGSIIKNIENVPVIHHYSDTGFFSVKLKISNEKGCSESITRKNLVRVPYVNANFSFDPLSCTYQKVDFKNLSIAESPVYLWNLGDSITSSEVNVSHQYKEEGVYSVSLALMDKNGCKSDTTRINAINILNPIAKFSVDNNFSTCPPLIVKFENSSKNYKSYEWNFGDNTNSKVLNPGHFYGSAGKFKSVLTVYGGKGCIARDTTEIEIKGPSGSFTYDILKGCVPMVVNFQSKTVGSVSSIWDFNDGNSSKKPDGNISHIYQGHGFYEPKLILTDAEGCQVPIVGTDTIKVYDVEAKFTYENRVCDKRESQFHNNSSSNDEIIKYHWNFGDNTFSSEKNPNKIYENAGDYNTVLYVISKEGCKDTTDLNYMVTVNKTPEIDIIGNSEVCLFSGIKFSGLNSKTDFSPVSWKWDFGNGKSGDSQYPSQLTYNSPGRYTVKAMAAGEHGCSDTSFHFVDVYDLPDLHITGEKVICLNGSTTLSVTGAYNYSWTNATSLSCTDCASPVASPDSSIQYKVIGVSNKGCRSVDSVLVKVKQPFKIIVSDKSTLCVGETAQLFAKGAENYSWTPAFSINDARSSNPVASPAITTTYMVVGQDNMKCFSDTGYVPIEVFKYPIVDAGEDKTINSGSTIDLIPFISPDVTNVVWQPNNGIIKNNNSGAITIKPVQTTTYSIAVKNNGGCLALDKVTVFVLCNNANIFIPNTFSPNGDGVNDVFFPRGKGVFKIKNIRVFDRWGQVVFERSNIMANDITTGWNGTYNGRKLGAEVFVYMVTLVCENNESIHLKGDLTLIR
ncbi:MAG: PKD domain-containing protein [Ginsengibacter sp.]